MRSGAEPGSGQTLTSIVIRKEEFLPRIEKTKSKPKEFDSKGNQNPESFGSARHKYIMQLREEVRACSYQH